MTEMTADQNSARLSLDEIEALFNESVQALLNIATRCDNFSQRKRIPPSPPPRTPKPNMGINSSAQKVMPTKEDVEVIQNNDLYTNLGAPNDNHNEAVPKPPKITNKCGYIINELITTEEDYISKLEYVCTNYKQWSLDNIGVFKTRNLFKNFDELFMDSVVFLQDLKSHQYTGDCQDIAKQFIKNISLFQKYTTYCRNQQSAETAYQNSRDKILEREIALDDKLGLHTGLLRPVQRLAKYEMLLKELQRAQEEEKPILDEALSLIQDVSQKSNNVVELEHLLDPKKYQANLRRSNSFQVAHKV
ncbi:guanine nucleotide exchange factor DBS-like [Atheta coriaria]|uniref:guanine nucleotide exchange factor DBS-like n=1 Tax=Dalotia coriaria TaxID=877792 RepID=UPI0031F3F0BF